jgi:hypothetical protein
MQEYTRKNAIEKFIETGLPVWHCRIWDIWIAAMEKDLPTSPNPGAVHFAWFCVIPQI